MLNLYVLSEDAFDDQVYVYLVEWLRGGEQVKLVPFQLRRGGGVGQVRKSLPLLASHIRQTGRTQDTAFLIAIDNDRAPEHPAHAVQSHSSGTQCRECGLASALSIGLPSGLPIPGAIAVPVEMIESWLLLIHDRRRFPTEIALPRFARSDQAAAQALLGAKPPPQLKDLIDEACAGQPKSEFALSCILKLDAKALGQCAPSFERFRLAVCAWP